MESYKESVIKQFQYYKMLGDKTFEQWKIKIFNGNTIVKVIA